MLRTKCTQQRCHGASSTQTAEELGPERLALDVTEIEPDDLAPTGVVHAVGDHQGLGQHAAAVADLDVLGVQPQIRVGALQRAGAELLDVLVQIAAEAADAVLVHALDAQLLDQPVDLPRRHTVDIGLHHDRHDRLLAAPPRLQKAREVRRPRPRARDRQLELAHARLPHPRAVSVEMRPALGTALAALGAGQHSDLRLHQLTHDQRDRVTQQISMLAGHRAGDDIGSGHHLALGHRGAPSHRTPGRADEPGRHGGRNLRADRRPLHHLYRHDPPAQLPERPRDLALAWHAVCQAVGRRAQLQLHD